MTAKHEPIAVVGMAIKVAGADDVQEFSQMLRTGKSQHELIGPDRLMMDTLFREEEKDPSRNWYGNFIRDVDAFDHKFFKRSPRESTTMDPQQRLFLQAAYQAVEQSGYFTENDNGGDKDKRHVGVYVGACAADYEHHVACHSANAFTATGNLKSFVPGKVSHYFGWTGPSMTFDTACSSSAVAIHTACQNLLSGECSAALAGGIATMSNFLWFQNLAGASFLSPSGQCKPFDDAADGYCRAEGIACVFLKRLSDALKDGNPVYGCIASTAVYQNQNCTPLFVPNSPSLSQLFRDVIAKAGLKPSDISLVEAHGTGTPVGDPAEYESIRLAIGGSNRETTLPIGSVKGHIGHTEGASGIVSLIKVIVMMQEKYIPPQASFSKMSSHIKVTPFDMMEVVTSLQHWGVDHGAMMAVESEEAHVLELLAEANESDGTAEIACHNGPRSFTLAGPTRSIERVAEVIARDSRFQSIKFKWLNVTNAFHSSLVDQLTPELEAIGRELEFKEPSIPLERATRTRIDSKPEDKFVSEHMRNPVYFNHAIQRLANDYPSAVFIEAGSTSGITMMASRALAGHKDFSSQYFQAINLTNDKAMDNLTDATLSLWNQGLSLAFWGHHPSQSSEYTTMMIPPYQFEMSKHWLELKSPLQAVNAAAAALGPPQSTAEGKERGHGKTDGLWSLVSGQADGPVFRINTSSEKYRSFISGHLIAQTAPICPATLMVDMAIEALFSINSKWRENGFLPVIHHMVNHSPLCVNSSLTTYLKFEPLGDQGTHWKWRIYSHESQSDEKHAETHVEAEIHIRDPLDRGYQSEFSRFDRLVTHTNCTKMLQLGLGGHQADRIDVLTGRNIYRTFSDVVDYGDLYRGVGAIVGSSTECTGHIVKKPSGITWLDVPLSDSFSQVGGIWVNCMTDCDPADMFIATGCELSMRSPFVDQESDQTQESWHIFGRHTRQSEKLWVSDLFIFNASTGLLREVMMGIQYARVAKASMRRMLTRLTTDPSALKLKPPTEIISKPTEPILTPPLSPGNVAEDRGASKEEGVSIKPRAPSHPDITEDVKKLVAHVAGIEAGDITLDAEMADFGIDSLMGMEVAREVQVVFKCTLDQNELMEATSLRKFVVCISKALYGPDYDGASASSTDDNSESSGSSSDLSKVSSLTTPTDLDLAQTPPKPSSSMDSKPVSSNLQLSASDVLASFAQVKLLCDEHLVDFKVDNIDREVLAGSSRLCVALVVEAFEQLGASLTTVEPGRVLERIQFPPAHTRLVDFIYRFLSDNARLIDINDTTGQITRTRVPTPRKTSSQILEEQLAKYPEFVVANRLTYYAGTHLADVLKGKTDGLRLIFGSIEGRDLVQALYCDHTFNRMNYNHMKLVTENLVERLGNSQPGETLKILEVGAGTGGTTHVLAPMLAKLGIPVEYTFTDISGSMVANARRKFGKSYPFMRFAFHDIETPPAEDLKGQHIIIGSNAVHATRNLVTSASNLRSALRADGFLMILEMTESVPFVDIIFGLLEGWWLFDDGRQHAIITAEEWERNLHNAGYGHVDWTDGSLPENTFQKVIIALASGKPRDRLPKSTLSKAAVEESISEEQERQRELEIERYIAKYSAGFEAHNEVRDARPITRTQSKKAVVLLTGATGSLGSHLASSLASNDHVETVVCINRRSRAPVEERQDEAFRSRGITLTSAQQSKLRILEVDASSSNLGLPTSDYEWLVQNGTHIIHNAWPMSGTRPVKAFEPQFRALRHLLDLARDMSRRKDVPRITFQLVSSIGVVGHFNSSRGPEERVSLGSVLHIGYCEAKWACERILDQTLHKHPDVFDAMVVRPGQIAGSSKSGFWNPIEHFAFLVKSAQSLRAWPDFDGVVQWVPVDNVANTMVDFLYLGDIDRPEPHPVYHIDNPVGQPWKVMSQALAAALDIPPRRIIPFSRWVKLVRNSPLPADTWNPAARLIDFLDSNFERMSCGGLILDTMKAQKHSSTLSAQGPVTTEIAVKYIRYWKESGFLA
ncbi:probable polyketide synthase [Fusarium mangiferae]|uniref:Probable polyketide synthase n=1 Tax=Fusarium mangiferae TaxID=192010 RepID=A0A1L7TXT8_FUSMA|nr:putative polyketide synthase [Fusarium mangiferae]CVL03420.1 probable polyketide synthase [Fusarium mangiferae]